MGRNSRRKRMSAKLMELLRFVRFTNEFNARERAIWYKGVDTPERVGEHSYQLAMVAWYLAQRHFSYLSLDLVRMYALVHDLPEWGADDTPAFPDRFGKHTGPSREDKEEREERARHQIKQEWDPFFPEMVDLIEAYERQEDDESRFVYAVDKFVAMLNVYIDGGRTHHKLGVTKTQQEQYKRPRVAKFPPLLDLYDEFCAFCEQRPDVYFNPALGNAARPPV